MDFPFFSPASNFPDASDLGDLGDLGRCASITWAGDAKRSRNNGNFAVRRGQLIRWGGGRLWRLGRLETSGDIWSEFILKISKIWIDLVFFWASGCAHGLGSLRWSVCVGWYSVRIRRCAFFSPIRSGLLRALQYLWIMFRWKEAIGMVGMVYCRQPGPLIILSSLTIDLPVLSPWESETTHFVSIPSQ